MTRPLLCILPGAEHLADGLASHLGADLAEMDYRRFPDGESYLRFITTPRDRNVALVSCLSNPDEKLIALMFAARTARTLGANSVGLISPYMPYLRQDKAFHDGESVSAAHIGALLSEVFSWVVTLDPHLHRLSSLADVFSVPATATTATAAIAKWIDEKITRPFLIGPDAESKQWVSDIAERSKLPYATCEKVRLGDTHVEIKLPARTIPKDCSPVIVDDIVSSGGSLTTLIKLLQNASQVRPTCCIVHGLFSGDAFARVRAAGAGTIVSTNSIPHESNAIDICPILADAASRHLTV